MDMSINTHDEQLLKKLASAISDNPRANTQTLAECVGISRATFNRFCGSREHLMEMISRHAEISLEKIIELANENVKDYSETFSKLIDAHFSNQEYLVFSCGTQCSLTNSYWEKYLGALDSFFLNGQKAGFFRLDLPHQMITELFLSMICGMIDAQHRGRVAISGIENSMKVFFLNGVAE
jgi:TetR/AcrR family transcriptional repressor of mexCD-oprJ operon